MVDAVLSALTNLLILAGLPLIVYYAYHTRRHKRSFKEIASRAGLQLGEPRFIGYCSVVAIILVAILIFRPLSLESAVRDGSAFQSFSGLGFGTPATVMALLYGVVKTGLAEEVLFRGLIAGSLSRRLSVVWSNLVQAVIFLIPHLFLLLIMPEMWGILPVIFVGSLFVGWVRIKSGSILGPWLIHAAVNVTMAMSVAVRTAA